MKSTSWPARSCAALAALWVAACGLSANGLQEGDGGELAGNDGAPDTTVGEDAGSTDALVDTVVDSTLPIDVGTEDASSPLDSPIDTMPPQDGSACANTPTSCGSPGACANCTTSSRGGICVGGACGCNGAPDCPAPSACQSNHVCGNGCGGPGQSPCNDGCCSVGTCVAFDNNHCGGACTACAGQTPTCGPNGMCNGSCGGPGDGTCQTSCCNGGTCANVGNQSCGDFGQSCTNCTGSDAGTNCELIALNYVCGCDGPGSANQCSTGKACYNQQCTTTCDGQHPCNGGCCSGNNLASSTCVPSCDAGMTCTGNYCQ